MLSSRRRGWIGASGIEDCVRALPILWEQGECWTCVCFLCCGGVGGVGGELVGAPNDTAYKWWSCHSGLKLLCKLCRTFPSRFTVFFWGMPTMRTRWMAIFVGRQQVGRGLDQGLEMGWCYVCVSCESGISV